MYEVARDNSFIVNYKKSHCLICCGFNARQDKQINYADKWNRCRTRHDMFSIIRKSDVQHFAHYMYSLFNSARMCPVRLMFSARYALKCYYVANWSENERENTRKHEGEKGEKYSIQRGNKYSRPRCESIWRNKSRILRISINVKCIFP